MKPHRRVVDGDAGLRSGNAAGNGVGRRDRPDAGRFQGGAECMCPGIAKDEGVIAGQHRLRVGTAEGDGSSVGRGRVAKGVLSRDLHGLRDAGGCRQRKTVDHQLARGLRIHRDAALTAFDAAGHGVGGGN